MPQPPKLEIFMDGACPFCQAVRTRVEPFDTRHRLLFADYNDPAVAARAPFPRERLDQEMHVRAADGSWHVGYAGWIAVLRELPRLAWLGFLLRLWPIRLAGPAAYRWLARHRYRLPGFPPVCEKTASPPQPIAR
jgi:predicted DCC family thiol-disulfide oxidoreductase YuxK